MIIRGILDRSLSSQLCIRGFAPYIKNNFQKKPFCYSNIFLAIINTSLLLILFLFNAYP
jgi:hypothetical protein